MTTSDNISAIEAIEKAMEAATPGVWDVWEEQTPNKADAIAEMAYQVENSDPFVEVVYLLNADGKCPATTGCGPTSAANAAYISACSPDRMRLILAEARKAAALKREIAGSWNAIDTCPIREPVDLWCVYGGEEFAQFEGGASIGKMVSNRIKSEEYGFFGNQSNDGVPQRDGPDLVPVAWRKAVPSCPAEIIAKALGVPLTLEDVLSTTRTADSAEAGGSATLSSGTDEACPGEHQEVLDAIRSHNSGEDE